MNLKRWIIATLGAFAVIFVAEFVVHHLWLSEFYQAHAEWWRPAAEMQSLMSLMFFAQFVLAALLAVVYAKGYQTGRGRAAQGLRFGFLARSFGVGCSAGWLNSRWPVP